MNAVALSQPMILAATAVPARRPAKARTAAPTAPWALHTPVWFTVVCFITVNLGLFA